jgi:hypothetical protein
MGLASISRFSFSTFRTSVSLCAHSLKGGSRLAADAGRVSIEPIRKTPYLFIHHPADAAIHIEHEPQLFQHDGGIGNFLGQVLKVSLASQKLANFLLAFAQFLKGHNALRTSAVLLDCCVVYFHPFGICHIAHSGSSINGPGMPGETEPAHTTKVDQFD